MVIILTQEKDDGPKEERNSQMARFIVPNVSKA